jgi:hypothetical protein
MNEIVLVALITTVGGLIGLVLYSKQSIVNWSMKMDYMENNLKYKMNIEKIRAEKSIAKEKLKQENKSGGLDLGNIDLDQIQDIVEGLDGEGSILNNPIVKGILQGVGGGKQREVKQLPPEFQNAEFED